MSNHQIAPSLLGWYEKRHPLPKRFCIKDFVDKVDSENWRVWVSFEEVAQFHKVNEMHWVSLEDSIDKTNSYLRSASEITYGLHNERLEGEEQIILSEKIGPPPIPCLPIYIVTCKEDEVEEIVYIGKTKTKSRFSGGHSVAIKLHHPKYNLKEKKIYRCSIWFLIEDDYVVLDSIKPKKLALELLDSIESQLIYNYQPDLNIEKKTKKTSICEFTLHLQNFLPGKFLNDTFVFPIIESDDNSISKL